jgi:PAS domain-containing protein
MLFFIFLLLQTVEVTPTPATAPAAEKTWYEIFINLVPAISAVVTAIILIRTFTLTSRKQDDDLEKNEIKQSAELLEKLQKLHTEINLEREGYSKEKADFADRIREASEKAVNAVITLNNLERATRSIISHSKLPFWIANKEGKCEFVNYAWCELAGMTVEEATDDFGEGWEKILIDADAKKTMMVYESAIREEKPHGELNFTIVNQITQEKIKCVCYFSLATNRDGIYKILGVTIPIDIEPEIKPKLLLPQGNSNEKE